MFDSIKRWKIYTLMRKKVKIYCLIGVFLLGLVLLLITSQGNGIEKTKTEEEEDINEEEYIKDIKDINEEEKKWEKVIGDLEKEIKELEKIDREEQEEEERLLKSQLKPLEELKDILHGSSTLSNKVPPTLLNKEDWEAIRKLNDNLYPDDLPDNIFLFDSRLEFNDNSFLIKHSETVDLEVLVGPLGFDKFKVVNGGVAYKTSTVSSKFIYDFYTKLRRHVIGVTLQLPRRFNYPRQNKIVSSFTKCDEFFDFSEEKADFFESVEDNLIFKKILIYIYYICIVEMTKSILSDLDLWAEYMIGSGNQMHPNRLEAFFSNYLKSFLSFIVFKHHFITKYGFFKEYDVVHEKILSLKEIEKTKQEIIEKYFFLMEEKPILYIINNISIEVGGKTLLPFGFFERVINSIYVELFKEPYTLKVESLVRR